MTLTREKQELVDALAMLLETVDEASEVLRRDRRTWRLGRALHDSMARVNTAISANTARRDRAADDALMQTVLDRLATRLVLSDERCQRLQELLVEYRSPPPCADYRARSAWLDDFRVRIDLALEDAHVS